MSPAGLRALTIGALAETIVAFLIWQARMHHVTNGLAVTVIAVGGIGLAYAGGLQRGQEAAVRDFARAQRQAAAIRSAYQPQSLSLVPRWPDTENLS